MERKKLEEYNNLLKNWIVYKLVTTEDSNTIYVGITCQSNLLLRLFDHFNVSISRDGYSNHKLFDWLYSYWRTIDIIKLEENILSKEDAFLLESEYIFNFRKKGMFVLNDTYVPVNAYDLNGNFYKTFPSYIHVFKELNIKASQVAKSVSSGCYCNKKYRFIRYDLSLNNIENIEKFTNKIKGKKRVLQFDAFGKFIKSWEHKCAAASAFKVDRSYFNRIIANKRILNGFIFVESDKDIESIDISEYENIFQKIENNILMYNSEINKKFSNIDECVKYLMENKHTLSENYKVIRFAIREAIKLNTKYLKFNFKIYESTI